MPVPLPERGTARKSARTPSGLTFSTCLPKRDAISAPREAVHPSGPDQEMGKLQVPREDDGSLPFPRVHQERQVEGSVPGDGPPKNGEPDDGKALDRFQPVMAEQLLLSDSRAKSRHEADCTSRPRQGVACMHDLDEARALAGERLGDGVQDRHMSTRNAGNHWDSMKRFQIFLWFGSTSGN